LGKLLILPPKNQFSSESIILRSPFTLYFSRTTSSMKGSIKENNMGKVIIDRDRQVSKVEERWLSGTLGLDSVDVHVLVYRLIQAAQIQFAATAHVHKKPGGGKMMFSSGAPKLDNLRWVNSVDAAVSVALDILEAREDAKV
jgi:hypothetical protein